MKKNLLLLFFVSLSILGFSQPDTISTNIYQYNGNLGIGVSNPETKLRIEDNVSGGNNRSLIRLRNTNYGSKSSVSISMESNDKNYGASVGFTSESYTAIPDFNKMGFISTNGNGFSIYSSSDYGSLRFYTNMHQNRIIERMRITADGYVGIGTSSPSSLLYLEGNVSSGIERNLLQINNKADGSLAYTGILLNTGNSQYQSVIQDYNINYSGSAHYDFGGFLNISNNAKGLIFHANSSSGKMKFYTGHDEVAGAGIERMRIDENGFIGINQQNPSRRLDINGAIHIEPISNTPETAKEGDIYMDAEDHILKYYNGSEWIFIDDTIQRYDSIFHFDTIVQYDSVFIYDTIYVVTNSETNKEQYWSQFDSSVYYKEGFVGIGTDSPSSKLQVADGDIYIEDIQSGMIMKSPNGQCWRGLLDDSGNLTFNQIECPETATSVTKNYPLGNEITIYPNPAKNKLTMISSEYRNALYEIFDINGKLCDDGKIRNYRKELDISTFSPGLYIINLKDKTGNLITSEKFVKQ